jgi:DNA-binding transcriptional ArsR family regulator
MATAAKGRRRRGKDRALDHVFFALADPTRRALMERLKEGEATVGELALPFDLTFAAVSKHLGILESAGLVSRAADGRFRRCRLLTGPLVGATVWLSRYVGYWEKQFETLVLHLDELARKERR